MPVKQRLGKTAADETSDRLDFRHDHCSPDPAVLRSRRNRRCRPRISDHVPAQIPRCILANPAAVDVEAKLGRTLNQNGAGIGRAQHYHELKWPFFDQVVDDAALYFQRNDFKQKSDDRQTDQRNLVSPADREDIAKEIGRQPIWQRPHHPTSASVVRIACIRRLAATGLSSSSRTPRRVARPGAGIQPSGHQYSRELYTPFLQIIDDVETAGTGHVLVDQQTACRAMPLISQECASRTVRLHVEPKRFEQCLQRVGDRLIVIDNADRLLNFARRRVVAKEGHADLLVRMPLRAGFRGAED
jgi:hypothetical protein